VYVAQPVGVVGRMVGYRPASEPVGIGVADVHVDRLRSRWICGRGIWLVADAVAVRRAQAAVRRDQVDLAVVEAGAVQRLTDGGHDVAVVEEQVFPRRGVEPGAMAGAFAGRTLERDR